MKFATAAQDGWATPCSMFSQRISSRMESRDCCFCDCRTEIRLQERSQGKCLWQLTGSICSKKVLEAAKAGTTVFTTCLDLMDLRLSRTHTSMISNWFQEGLQDIQGCPETSCAHSSREATVWHRRALWLDHFQGCESHTVNQAKSQLGLEYLSIDLAG